MTTILPKTSAKTPRNNPRIGAPVKNRGVFHTMTTTKTTLAALLATCRSSTDELAGESLDHINPVKRALITKKMQDAGLIPKNGKFLKTQVRGTSFADPQWLAVCQKIWEKNGDINLTVALEPTNPRPPAYRIDHGGRRLGYLAAELAPTLTGRELSIAGVIQFFKMPNPRRPGAYVIDLILGYGPEGSQTAQT